MSLFPKKFDLVLMTGDHGDDINYILSNNGVWRAILESKGTRWYRSEFTLEDFEPYKIIGTDLTYEECLFLMNL